MASRATIPAVLLASIALACHAPPHLSLDPELVSTEVRGEDDALLARVVAVWRGTRLEGGVPELRFRVRVENRGSVPFMLAPAEFELLDSESVSLGTVRGLGLPERESVR